MHTLFILLALTNGSVQPLQLTGFHTLAACVSAQTSIVRDIEDSAPYVSTGAIIISSNCYALHS